MNRRDLTTVFIAVAALAAAAGPISITHADSGPWHWIALLTGLALYAWLACGVGGVLWGAASEHGRKATAARYEARMKATHPLGPLRYGYRVKGAEALAMLDAQQDATAAVRPTVAADVAADTGPEAWLGRVEHWAQQAAEAAADEAEQVAA